LDIELFKGASGFKVLAMARLDASEYSLLLYLLHCRSSGFQEIVSTETDLSNLLGYPIEEIARALKALRDKSMIGFRYGKSTSTSSVSPSLSMGFQFDIAKWKLETAAQPTSQEAIVYPFSRDSQASFLLVPPVESVSSMLPGKKALGWKDLSELFQEIHGLSPEQATQLDLDAQFITKSHPIEQALLLVRHFRARIPSLALLAGSWQQYVELYESETQKIDLFEAKDRHLQIEQALRDSAIRWDHEVQDLSVDEREVLRVIISHPHPRRQLFWAYQLRIQYPKLQAFFQENADKMLAITSMGTPVKRVPSDP
jgi:hypothetical protein